MDIRFTVESLRAKSSFTWFTAMPIISTKPMIKKPNITGIMVAQEIFLLFISRYELHCLITCFSIISTKMWITLMWIS